MEDLILTILSVALIVAVILYVRSYITKIVDNEPDLELAKAQNAPLFIGDPDRAKEFIEQYQRRENGETI